MSLYFIIIIVGKISGGLNVAIMSFCRYEKKFLVSAETAKRFVEKITPYVSADPYCIGGKEYAISNIYFDNDNNTVIEHSLSKPKYKEKLRVRSYGVPDSDSNVFIELKKKVNGLTLKRRAKLSLTEMYEYFESGKRPDSLKYINRQVLDEVDYYLERNKVKPKIYIAYDRTAYFANDDSTIRISIDRNIRTRRHDLKLDSGDYGDDLLARWIKYRKLDIKDPRLIEIKISNSFPLWLVNALSSEEMRMRAFSKYGNEYKMFINDFETDTHKEKI